ncbi:MAG: SDR family oxidoreductase [Candidatus Eremiobacterota bacterium]
MRGKTALITGASGGIGLELARCCAADGCRLVLVARSRDRLERLAAELKQQHGTESVVLEADLARPDAPARVAEQAGSVDVLINNAGVGSYGPFLEQDLQRTLDMLQLNVTSLTELTRRVAPGMVTSGWGRVMNVASTAAFQPGPLMAVYYASKAYVLSFSEALANELQGTGVTVTALCPGPTESGFQASASMQESRLLTLFKMPSSAEVARSGYAAMKRGKRVHITGVMNWLMAQSVRFTPRDLATWLVRKMQDKTQRP